MKHEVIKICLLKHITINIDANVIDYVKKQPSLSDIPYQTLINLYLTDYMNEKKPNISWK